VLNIFARRFFLGYPLLVPRRPILQSSKGVPAMEADSTVEWKFNYDSVKDLQIFTESSTSVPFSSIFDKKKTIIFFTRHFG